MPSVCHRATTYRCLDSCKVGDLDYKLTQHLILASSAPGESSPLLVNTHAAASDIRHNIVRANTMISEVHRDVVNTHTMVRDVLKSQEGAGGQDRSVSNTYSLTSSNKC